MIHHGREDTTAPILWMRDDIGQDRAHSTCTQHRERHVVRRLRADIQAVHLNYGYRRRPAPRSQIAIGCCLLAPARTIDGREERLESGVLFRFEYSRAPY